MKVQAAYVDVNSAQGYPAHCFTCSIGCYYPGDLVEFAIGQKVIVLGEQEPKDALVDPSGPAGESTVQQRGAHVFEPSNGVHNPLAALDLLLVKLRKTSISLPSIGRSAPPAPNSWRMSWWLRGGLGDADYS